MFKIYDRAFRERRRWAAPIAALCLGVLGSGAIAQQAKIAAQQPRKNSPLAVPNHAAVPNELLIGLTPESEAAGGDKMISALGTTVRHFAPHRAYHLRVRPGTDMQKLMARLRKMSGVSYVEPNHIVSHADISLPNDPALEGSGAQWAPLQTATIQAWNIWKPKNTKPIIIAIVDSGVDDTHPDLTNMMLRDAYGTVIGYNVLTNTAGPTPADCPHGTHVAGIAAAQTNNGQGISGMAGWTGDAGFTDTSHIKVMPVKVLDANGNGTTANVAAGVDWAVAHGANIINLSLGGPDPDFTLYASIENAWAKNCVVVAAAGNYGSTTQFFPAADPNVISVAATSHNAADSLPSWSSRGWWVTVSAPGDGIYSTMPNGQYAYDSGSSMASPHVAGLAALIWAQNPLLKNSDVMKIITGSTDKYPASANPISRGGGRINSNRALLAVNAGLPTVSGLITLQNSVNAAQNITLEFRSLDGTLDYTCPVTLTPTAPGSCNGSFSVAGIPGAAYSVAIKGANWLQKTVALTPAALSAPLAVSLEGGDANGDNRVDASDFGMLISAYGADASAPNSGYDARADFNDDGLVDSTDFGILIGNYGDQGDS